MRQRTNTVSIQVADLEVRINLERHLLTHIHVIHIRATVIRHATRIQSRIDIRAQNTILGHLTVPIPVPIRTVRAVMIRLGIRQFCPFS